MTEFHAKVAAAGKCPTCDAWQREPCINPRTRKPKDAPHDSRVRVFEDWPCGECESGGMIYWCYRHKGHAGQHKYEMRIVREAAR